MCDDLLEVVRSVQARVPFELREVDITTDPALFEAYRFDIPVVHINGQKAFKHRLTAQAFEARLQREQLA